MLAEWKVESAKTIWRARIADPLASAVSVQLAFKGLAACNDVESGDKCVAVAGDTQVDYLKRQAAARAAAILVPNKAHGLATSLQTEDEPSRLLAMDLLNSNTAASLEAALKHTNDSASAVASAAWELLFRHKPELLLPALDEGRKYKDANVRITALRVMRLFPDAQ